MFRPIRMDHTNCLQVAIKTLLLLLLNLSLSLSLSLSHSLSLVSLCHLSDGGHVSENVSLSVCDSMDVDDHDMGITGPDLI